jgi:hypothetical protein
MTRDELYALYDAMMTAEACSDYVTAFRIANKINK